MISRKMPNSFIPKFEVVSCFVQYNDTILLLHRQDHKSEGNTWGVPAGKVDHGENIHDAIIREVFEETAIQLKPTDIHYHFHVFVTYPTYQFIYHIFSTHINNNIAPRITINPNEHKSFVWIPPTNAKSALHLIPDLDACINLIFE